MGARTFLLHGLLAGLIAGVLAFGVASLVGEPAIDAAIALEGAPAEDDHAHAEGTAAHEHDDEVEISRTTQAGIGLLVGLLASGAVIGGLTGLASALALGRVGSLGPVGSTSLVTAVGALAFSVVPFLKYPATPPAAGDPATINERTATYFGFVVLSLAAAVAAVWLARRLRHSTSTFVAVASAAFGYVVVVAVAAAALPTAEVGDFPGQLLWEFRVAALLVLVTLWGTVALVLTGLVDLSWRRASADAERRELAASL